MSDRINLGKLKEVIPPPDLLEHQLNSYKRFLQKDVPPSERENVGLEKVFRDFFPIESEDGKHRLEYVSYRLGEPANDHWDCIRDETTYGAPLYVTLRFDRVLEHEICLGSFPLMTNHASFVIKGVERVVLCQLRQAPGCFFRRKSYPSGSGELRSFSIEPYYGVRVNFELDGDGLMYVCFRAFKLRCRFLVTVFLRVFGFDTDESILRAFYRFFEMPVSDLLLQKDLSNLMVIKEESSGMPGCALVPLTGAFLQSQGRSGVEVISVVDVSADGGVIARCLKCDVTSSKEEAQCEIFRAFTSGRSFTSLEAETFVRGLFFNPASYNLTSVGRSRLNQRLGSSFPLSETLLQPDDVVRAVCKFYCWYKNGGIADDIDSLEFRYVRRVGCSMEEQCRLFLSSSRRAIQELVSRGEFSSSSLALFRTMSGFVTASFFKDELSQLIDQVNPLSEMCQKRRLSVLGKGGAGRRLIAIRDVHPSYYGRICPIETPEGASIGLINAFAVYACVDKLGFIETPYRRVYKGVVTKVVDRLLPEQEKLEVIAPADSNISPKGRLEEVLIARKNSGICRVRSEDVTYMDVSTSQFISVVAALVPFLEHDEAGRVLMASNMLRQAVPLLKREAPLVGTGMEAKVVRNCSGTVLSKSDGKVAAVSGTRIVITSDGVLPHDSERALQADPRKGMHIYSLHRFQPSVAKTCFDERPLVRLGDFVKVGQNLTEGWAVDRGELALGRNVLVAYLPWHGFNFEDAVVVSSRIISEDIYTSICIKSYEISISRDSALNEEFTRDIPGVSGEVLKNLDNDGIVRIGSMVHPGDILVGKIASFRDSQSPEDRLLRAIFDGKEFWNVKDLSLIAPSDCIGYVVDVRVKRSLGVEGGDSTHLVARRSGEPGAEAGSWRVSLMKELSGAFMGEVVPFDIMSGKQGKVLVRANRRITKEDLYKLVFYMDEIQMKQSPFRERFLEIIAPYVSRVGSLKMEREVEGMEFNNKTKKANSGIESVVVSVAVKRAIKVGDKMAGRHGNKGVVSCVVPFQDMPFLEDGTPVDIVLSPLGVQSRMNIGQIFELHLGFACKLLGIKVSVPSFSGHLDIMVKEFLKKASLPEDGKVVLYDGCTGEPFKERVAVGYAYMLKLNHFVDDKFSARSTGSYSLVSQQPLGGRLRNGGQRFGEMEVWALESYGVAYTLQELMTVRSDDVRGRLTMYQSLVRGCRLLQAGVPNSFQVLVKIFRGMCVDVSFEG